MTNVIISMVLCRTVCRKLLCVPRVSILFETSLLPALRNYCVDDYDNKRPINSAIVTKIQNQLNCEVKVARKLYNQISHESKLLTNTTINTKLKILIDNGVTVDSMLENTWLFAICDLNARLKILHDLRPKNINDFVPLLVLNRTNLKSILYIAMKDAQVLPFGYKHRIYYFSDELQIPPKIVAKRFADNPFMLIKEFQQLANKLAIFCEYGIKPANLLRDIGIFGHSEEYILRRLIRLKEANITNVMPWMIKCLDGVFESTIQSRLDESDALGKHNNVESFLVEYLDIDKCVACEMLKKYPRLSGRKVRKIKDIIDYLLNETNYTKEDIASTPRILFFSLETIRDRIEQLKMVNSSSFSHLSELTQGTNRFKKLVES